MTAQIIPMKFGFDTIYAVKESATILVDGGQPGKSKSIPRRFASAGLTTEEIKLIVITHGHWDHLGCAAALKEHTGAPIAMHQAERARLEQGLKQMPAGRTAWGKLFGVAVRGMMRFAHIEPTTVDIPITDEEVSLEPYGINGKILHTPGHSPGSLTVLLDGGEALVGDLAMNMFPLKLRPGLPIFAEDPENLRGSIEKLIAAGARTIYPAHGPSFPVAVLERALSRL